MRAMASHERGRVAAVGPRKRKRERGAEHAEKIGISDGLVGFERETEPVVSTRGAREPCHGCADSRGVVRWVGNG